jgi:DNA ligase-associated metallophosphoesterase
MIEGDMKQRLVLTTCAGDIVLDNEKAAFLPGSKCLLVADLHFEKGSYLQAKGHAPLPTYDTVDTLERLAGLIKRYRPKTVAALGDSFHDIAAGERLSGENFRAINDIVDSVSDFIWILGNHDPDIPKGLRGRQEDHIQFGDFLLTHLPTNPGSGLNICGHLHPKVSLKTSRRKFWKPCFACADNRIILPSFGTFTGGLDVSHPAIECELEGNSIYFAITESGLIGLDKA